MNAETFETVTARMHAAGLTQIPEVLRSLDPDLSDHFTLMKRSASSQEASAQFPRALLFGTDAKLMIGFNACPAQRGFNNLEIIQYRDQKDAFEFREIAFERGHTPRISDPNPGRCLSCHGNDPRPIWLSYAMWMNREHEAYGSDDDYVDGSDAEYVQFRAEAEVNPRYQLLGGDRSTSGWPYQTLRVRGREHRPNLRLGQALNVLNARWLAARMIGRPSVGLAYLLWRASTYERSALSTLIASFPDRRWSEARDGKVRYKLLIHLLMEQMDLPRMNFGLGLRHSAAYLEDYRGHWDGRFRTDDLLLYQLWGAWTDRPKVPLAEFKPDRIRGELWSQFRPLTQAFLRARCQEGLESSGPASYGSRTTPQEKFFGATRSL